MKLRCELSKAIGDVKWFKDGKELTPSKNITITTDGKKRVLIVRKAEKANIGEYTCDCSSDKTTAKLNIEGICQHPGGRGLSQLRTCTFLSINKELELVIIRIQSKG